MRQAHTYRGARCNLALRDNRMPWGPQHYHGEAPKIVSRVTMLRRKPSRYHPLTAAGEYLRALGKRWVGKRSVHQQPRVQAAARG